PSELIEELCLLAEQIGCPTPGPSRVATWIPPKPPAHISLLQRHLPWMIPLGALLGIVAILDRWQLDDLEPSDGRRPAAEQLDASLSGKPVAEAVRGKSPPVNKTNIPKGASAAEIDAQANRRVAPADRSPEDAPGNPQSEDTSPAAPAASGNQGENLSAASVQGSPDSPAPVNRPAAEDAPKSSSGGSKLATTDSVAASETKLVGTGQKTSEGAGPIKPPALEALQPGLLVVGEGEGPQRYATLSAACNAAKSGDVIELRYNGRRQEIPITLENRDLKIRAKEPYQPIVAFTPNDADPYNFPHSMLRVVGGRLRLQNVAFELNMPRGVYSEDWTLFEAQMVESFDLNKCELTIKNASDQGGSYHDKVSFFHVKPSPGAEAMMPKGMMSAPTLEIQLQDCLVRGEATFLRDDDAQAVRVQWRNGLFASSEWLLSAAGATTMQSASGGENGKIHVTLEHLTLVLGSGLCRMSNSYSAPALLDVDLKCSDSVVLGGADRSTLIEQASIDSPSESQRRLSWKGDRNFYGAMPAFWRVVDPSSAPLRPEMSFKDWRDYWGDQREVQSSIAPLVWKRRPAAGQPFHERTPADYTFDDAAEGPYLYDTNDAEMVGMNASALPTAGDDRNSAASPAPLANEAIKLD
ncbi:MAG TPA: hypothetical protein VHB99_18100, partial [Pirellulales bacterium]|nr:hypothetical protein [Pirellulales bacterium]